MITAKYLLILIGATSTAVVQAKDINQKDDYQTAFCMKFELAQDKYDVKVIIKEMEASPYANSIKEFWSTSDCTTPRNNTIKIPILYNTASSAVTSEKFPSVVYDYFVNKKNDRESWLAAINTKTSDGLTFLDFMHYNIEKNNYNTTETMDAALRVVSYLCKNGGVYSKYKTITKCP